MATAVLLAPAWPTISYAGEFVDQVDYLISELLYDTDDDDREDAAKALGKIADPRALPALEQAAIYDDEDDVRSDARKAIRRIREIYPGVVVTTAPPVCQPVAEAIEAAPQPAPQVVQVPQPVTVVAPAPVYVAPPPVYYYAPVAYRHVVVGRHYYPAPVVVHHGYPVRSYGPRFGFGFSYHHYRH